MEFFNTLDPMLRTYWFIAIPASIIFLLQAIMTFIGMDATDGNVPDFDGDTTGGDSPFQLFSFRNLINFLLGFGWGGICFYSSIENQMILGMVAILIGAIFLVLFFAIIKQLTKLEENNTFTLKMAIGKTGDVYLAIPENKTGSGLIQVSVYGAVREIHAITPGGRLESGAMIRVISVESDNLVLVERL